jgi:hypothetical protein
MMSIVQQALSFIRVGFYHLSGLVVVTPFSSRSFLWFVLQVATQLLTMVLFLLYLDEPELLLLCLVIHFHYRQNHFIV